MRILKIIVMVVVLGFAALVGGIYLFLGTSYEVADEPTPLMQAAQLANVEQVRRLIADGANVNERRGCSRRYGVFIAHGPSTPLCNDTALLAAIQVRNVELVRMLLDAGADPTVRDSFNRGVWEYVSNVLYGSGSDSELVYVLAKRIDLSPTEVDGLLSTAGSLGNELLLDFVLSKSPSVAGREAALCNAARRGDIALMTRLLETFETVPPKSLSCAIGVPYNIRRPAIELLLNRGVDPNGDAQAVAHPLSFVILTMIPGAAAQSVPPEVKELLELLLQRGSDPRLERNGAASAIALARHHGHEAVAVLLENWE